MTRDEEEIMKMRQAFAAPVAAAWNIEGCPEPDRIWSAVRGELPPDEIREVLDHVALCASCAEDWRIAMAFEEEARVREKAPVIPIPRFQPWVAAAAAALVLTIGGGAYEWSQRQSHQGSQPQPEYRGDKSKIEAAIPSGETLSREAFVLAWTPVAGAESYEILVTTGDLRTLAAPTGLTSTEYQLPQSALVELPAGTQLHWRVTAVFPDGGRIQSKTFTTALE